MVVFPRSDAGAYSLQSSRFAERLLVNNLVGVGILAASGSGVFPHLPVRVGILDNSRVLHKIDEVLIVLDVERVVPVEIDELGFADLRVFVDDHVVEGVYGDSELVESADFRAYRNPVLCLLEKPDEVSDGQVLSVFFLYSLVEFLQKLSPFALQLPHEKRVELGDRHVIRVELQDEIRKNNLQLLLLDIQLVVLHQGAKLVEAHHFLLVLPHVVYQPKKVDQRRGFPQHQLLLQFRDLILHHPPLLVFVLVTDLLIFLLFFVCDLGVLVRLNYFEVYFCREDSFQQKLEISVVLDVVGHEPDVFPELAGVKGGALMKVAKSGQSAEDSLPNLD